jgi:acetoin utilization deacetylase AcuC-like enzyme
MPSPDRPIHVVEDIRFRAHRSPPRHPENPERLAAVSRALARHADHLTPLAPRAAHREEIIRIHSPGHYAKILNAVKRAPAHLDADTFVSEQSLEIAKLAAGGTIDLALSVARGEAACGIAAVRPPGHHAEADRPMGFCLFNNVAIAARALQHELGLEKIAILDWDVHHGNGTQHSFENDPSILYVSLHQFPHYPGTGNFNEAGEGAGLGSTLNLALPPGCGDLEYCGLVHRAVAPMIRRFAPQMILVSCGFDAHRDDPLSDMNVSAEGYREMTHAVAELARDLCGGRLAFVLEGGYAASGLEEGTDAVLGALLDPGEVRPLPGPANRGLASLLEATRAVHAGRCPDLGAL